MKHFVDQIVTYNDPDSGQCPALVQNLDGENCADLTVFRPDHEITFVKDVSRGTDQGQWNRRRSL